MGRKGEGEGNKVEGDTGVDMVVINANEYTCKKKHILRIIMQL